MSRIVPIVEGHGELSSVRTLLQRVAATQSPGVSVEVLRPIRIKRQLLIKENELERAVELAARQSAPDGSILILLDADEDCPASLAPKLRSRALKQRGDRRVSVVLAKREYEAWFLAAAASIAGKRGISNAVTPPLEPEEIADAKGWLSRHMPSGRSYRETVDQPALTAIFDIEAARARASSLDKLCRDIEALLA